MQDLGLTNLLQYPAGTGNDLTPTAITAVVVSVLLVGIQLLRNHRRREEAIPATTFAETVPETLEPPAPRVQPEPAKSRGIPESRKYGSRIPRDSVLRRHYLTHLRYLVERATAPRPTDSVLRRHHDHLAQAEFEACLYDDRRLERLLSAEATRQAAAAETIPALPPPVVAAPIAVVATVSPIAEPVRRRDWIPEDSVLRRHFFGRLRHALATIAPPPPTDSVLRRHYNHRMATELERCLDDRGRIEALWSAYEASKAAATETQPAAPPPSPPVSAAAVVPTEGAPVRMPEDSVLRRHFLSRIRNALEMVSPSRPTDSVLRRHHDQRLACELEACLCDRTRLEKLLVNYEARRIAALDEGWK